MTNGGFAALAVALRAILEPGDEVVFLSPPWFFYELLILRRRRRAGARAARRRPRSTSTWRAIAAAITPRTRAVLVNSPHNPSGRVYPDRRPAGARRGRSTRRRRAIGRPIYLVSDEPYNRIVFDGRDVPQPRRGLPGHDHHLLVRQDAAGARACGSAT